MASLRNCAIKRAAGRARPRLRQSASRNELNAFILYDTLAAGIGAKTLLDHAVHHLGAPCETSVKIWKSDLLRDPWLLYIAAHEAAASSIVVLSLESHWKLPAEVTNWVDKWLNLRDGDTCLFLVVVREPGQHSGTVNPPLAALQRAATSRGVHLFLRVHGPEAAGPIYQSAVPEHAEPCDTSDARRSFRTASKRELR